MGSTEIIDTNTNSSITVEIDNDLETGDTAALAAFFIFLFAVICLAICVYYASPLRLWCRQSFWFPLRRLCCDGERKRLWGLHKDAVIRSDAVAASPPLIEMAANGDPPFLDDDPLEDQLDTLVGLEPLKDEIRALRRTLVVEQQRRKVVGGKGEQAKAPHMVFRGSPGTGKTHAARLIARLLKELGYVHGDIVEVQRADLVAGYVGQTALKTRAVINKAKNGVLFVDEAYALAPRGGQARDFGAEAVQELMRDLTSGDPVVILAGYPDEMEHFLLVNPGLSRRFQVRFTFPDYTAAQLAAIFDKIASRHGFQLDQHVTHDALEQIFASHFSPALCHKWNGGLPEGLFKRAQDALAKRLNVLTMSAHAATTLTLADISSGARILKATLGGDHAPSNKPSRSALTQDDDDDQDMYGEDSALLSPEQPLDNLVNMLSTPGLQRTLATVNTLAPRVAALEATVARFRPVRNGGASSSSSAPAPARSNPWDDSSGGANAV